MTVTSMGIGGSADRRFPKARRPHKLGMRTFPRRAVVYGPDSLGARGLFEGAAAYGGLVRSTGAPGTVMSRSKTSRIVLERSTYLSKRRLETLMGTSYTRISSGGRRNLERARRAILFYGLWPTADGLAWLPPQTMELTNCDSTMLALVTTGQSGHDLHAFAPLGPRRLSASEDFASETPGDESKTCRLRRRGN